MRHLEHPAGEARRGPLRRRRLPARDPGPVRALPPDADRRPGLPPPRLPDAPPPYSDEAVGDVADRTPGASLDDFDALLAHLSAVHPSRYGALLDDVTAVCLRGVKQVDDQSTALRLVVLADRMYDRELPITASGLPFDQVFPEEMLRGGYRKKYLRAISRLVALARDSAKA